MVDNFIVCPHRSSFSRDRKASPSNGGHRAVDALVSVAEEATARFPSSLDAPARTGSHILADAFAGRFPNIHTRPMSRDFAELDFQTTPLGDLSLRRRRVASLDDLEVFEVKLGDDFLMSSLFHEVEVALADLGLAALEAGNEMPAARYDVVVGGLGLGYTAVATLKHAAVREVIIVDFLEAVIGWHQRGLVPLGPTLTADPRCRLVHGDFFALAASAPGFDPAAPARRFHAILLDIDHSPRNLLHPRHAELYSPAGLRALATHLEAGGVFALWSDDPPDADFLQALRAVFATAKAHIVTFPNPLLDRESASTVYVACLATKQL